MKTTRKQALILFDIARAIDPFEFCSFDKNDFVKSNQEIELEENIKGLYDYILEQYETIEEVRENKTLIKLLKRLLRNVLKELWEWDYICQFKNLHELMEHLNIYDYQNFKTLKEFKEYCKGYYYNFNGKTWWCNFEETKNILNTFYKLLKE